MEKVFMIDGIRLCTESFGNPEDPAILLIMGAMSSMIWWDEEFCLLLADRGYFVIRFDNRDTGQSQTYEPGKPEYTVDDMADDCIRVLDFWGVVRAHFLGMSLGGMLAQIVALKYSGRVLSLNCLASSVWASVDPPLPAMSAETLANSERTRTINWSDTKTAVEYMVAAGRLLCGKGRVFDEKRHRELAELECGRSRNLYALQNYLLLGGGESWWDRVSEINIPVTVFHGSDDKVLPLPHGEAIARAIPEAKFVILDGAGHEIHKNDWEEIAAVVASLPYRRGHSFGKVAPPCHSCRKLLSSHHGGHYERRNF